MNKKDLGVLQPSIEDRLGELNTSYAIVRWNSQTLIMHERFEDGGRRIISFLSKDSFLLWLKNIFYFPTPAPGEKSRPINLGKVWLEWTKRRQFVEVLFSPNAVERAEVYNLWRGFSFEPDQNAGKFDIFLDHIRINVCNENPDHYHWVLGWMADLVQRPDRKLGTALVLRGEMGVGKSIVFRHLGALINVHYLSVQKTEHVTGRFNGHLADKLLVFLDEAFWAGNKEAESTLKTLVTEEDVTIEMKGKDLYRMRSYLRIGMSTNSDWSVPTGLQDERRFGIFDVGNGCKQNREYFAAMENQLNNGGYKGLLYFLLHYKYDPLEISKIPQTEALLDQKMYSIPEELRWWLNCLNEGKISAARGGSWELEIEHGSFYDSYLTYCKNMNVRRPLTNQWLVRTLNKRKLKFKEKASRQTTELRYYQILPLEDCRKSFEEMMGQPMQWEGE